MNDISKAGLMLAHYIASAYASHANVRAVIVGGSVSRGCADQYSDLEIGAFWSSRPTTSQRQTIIARIGGDLWSFDREPGNEHYGLSRVAIGGQHYSGTAMISTQHMLLSEVEACLADVIDHYDTSVGKQALLSALQHGTALLGVALIQAWQARAQMYPETLAIKVIQENLWMGPWFWPEAYLERDDILVLYQHFIWVEQGILKVLAGLNRLYYPSSEHKWMDELIGRMKVVPPHLASRMKEVLRVEPLEGWRRLKGLIDETLTLVEAHLPEVNRVSLCNEHPEVNTAWARQRWSSNPPYSLIEQIATSQRSAA